MLIGLVDRGTYQHANDWDQEDDLNQAVEYEEDAANHLGCSKGDWVSDLWNVQLSRCVWYVRGTVTRSWGGGGYTSSQKRKAQAVAITVQYARGRRCRGIQKGR